MKLSGKVAIITGASRGIGKAIAVGYAQEGANVVVAARTTEEKEGLPGTIHKTAEEVEKLGAKALAIKCDVTKEEDVDNMLRQTLDKFGRVDIMINNAAVAFYAPLLEMPLRRWELVLAVNLRGTFLCCKAVLPKMVEQGSGSIINLSSGAAVRRHLSPTGLAYGVAKAGIERFTWGLAAEVSKHNVAVNCLKPRGAVDTEGMRFWNPKVDWSQWDSPEMMVKAAIFLAQQDASGVTGTVATDEEYCAWHAL